MPLSSVNDNKKNSYDNITTPYQSGLFHITLIAFMIGVVIHTNSYRLSCAHPWLPDSFYVHTQKISETWFYVLTPNICIIVTGIVNDGTDDHMLLKVI